MRWRRVRLSHDLHLGENLIRRPGQIQRQHLKRPIEVAHNVRRRGRLRQRRRRAGRSVSRLRRCRQAAGRGRSSPVSIGPLVFDVSDEHAVGAVPPRRSGSSVIRPGSAPRSSSVSRGCLPPFGKAFSGSPSCSRTAVRTKSSNTRFMSTKNDDACTRRPLSSTGSSNEQWRSTTWASETA